MKDVLCLVLGGGKGTRLYPLTKDRSKPAVPFAGKYRLVDIPISNSLNSGINQIYVLTQFNSESLNKHVTRTYKLDSFSGGFVEIMAAEQSMDSVDWFQGTADAVRRCLKHFNKPNIKTVLILSGDHLYNMDFSKILAYHSLKEAEITIACKPVEVEHMHEFGIMSYDEDGRINYFIEKPKDEKAVRGKTFEKHGKRYYLASMGIYVFNKEALADILHNNSKADFGKEIIPESIPFKKTFAYVHTGYWKDIGSIKSFYEENLVLTDPIPPINLFDEKWPIFTRPRYLPPVKVTDSKIERSIIGEGCILTRCNVYHSVVGVRSRISEYASIEDSIVMGADFYQSINDLDSDREKGVPSIGIGRGSVIKRAIIDKNVRIGESVKIVNQNNLDNFESDIFTIRDGIVIIPKNTIIHSGTVI